MIFKFKYWYYFIFFVSFILRFWGLNRFNTLVFDEVYYAKFANNYFTATQFFNVHPPLSQYLIALGIWLTSWLPSDPDTVNNLTGSLLSTFNYRFANAFVGSFIPILGGGIAYQLTNNYASSIIAAIFFTVDGFFLVQSRYALSEIYLILFGLLGQLYFLFYLKQQKKWQLLVAGIFLGACVGVKWNGLGFLLGIYGIWVIARWTGDFFDLGENGANCKNISLNKLFVYLGIVPCFIYSIIWLPHLAMNPKFGGFWQVHYQILNYHERLGDSNIHPYCSPWYSWLIMWRPIGFYYQKVNQGQMVYDVHGMGNPILWWLSTVAIFWLLLKLIAKILTKTIHHQDWFSIYLLANYAANLLPWLKVSRCLFLYHYLPAYVFAILALAGILGKWWSSDQGKIVGLAIILLVISAFIFWLPLYLGLPISPKEFSLRIWFKSWI